MVDMESLRRKVEGVENWLRSVKIQVNKPNPDMFWLEQSVRCLAAESDELFEMLRGEKT